MNYSLSSSRKIGDYIQKIITTQNNAPKATSSSFYDSLALWHNLLLSLDPVGRVVENIEYKGFTETESEKTDNDGTKADIIFTVLSNISYIPKTTTIKVYDVTIENAITKMKEAYNTLTGSSINLLNNYLISALINLH